MRAATGFAGVDLSVATIRLVWSQEIWGICAGATRSEARSPPQPRIQRNPFIRLGNLHHDQVVRNAAELSILRAWTELGNFPPVVPSLLPPSIGPRGTGSVLFFQIEYGAWC
jgi:hypothetical protein